jgi:transcriptional regulator with XRE-family HTH domain
MTAMVARDDPVGEWFRELRIERNMTARQLSQKVGTDARTIYRWESGDVRPSLGPLRKKLARSLGTTTAEIARRIKANGG